MIGKLSKIKSWIRFNLQVRCFFVFLTPIHNTVFWRWAFNKCFHAWWKKHRILVGVIKYLYNNCINSYSCQYILSWKWLMLITSAAYNQMHYINTGSKHYEPWSDKEQSDLGPLATEINEQPAEWWEKGSYCQHCIIFTSFMMCLLVTCQPH